MCSKPGQSDTKIAEAINKRITDGKTIVYVPIITGYGTGTSPTTVVGFAAFELQPI
ncbi:hypothetical protein [Neobacillus drentensis]|uniref:hypothetical protein n=1 Tax=Neobacillus drentensis TaxID=220684 RepID=UPI002FFF656A